MSTTVANLVAGLHAGHCNQTAGVSDCETGSKGTLPLRSDTYRSWSAAAAACAAGCDECERCNFISLSLSFKACSWYAECDLASLHTTPIGFQSAAVPSSAAKQQRAVERAAAQDRSLQANPWMSRVRDTSLAAFMSHSTGSARNKEQLLWPFATEAALRRSPWAAYFERIYGIGTMRFPFALSELSYFYIDLIPRHVLKSLRIHPCEAKGHRCIANASRQIRFGELYGHASTFGGTRRSSMLQRLQPAKRRSLLNVWRCIYPYCSGSSPIVPVDLFPSLEIARGFPSHRRQSGGLTCLLRQCGQLADWQRVVLSGRWQWRVPGSSADAGAANAR